MISCVAVLVLGLRVCATSVPTQMQHAAPVDPLPRLAEPWRTYEQSSAPAWQAWWDHYEELGPEADELDINLEQDAFLGTYCAEHPECINRIIAAAAAPVPDDMVEPPSSDPVELVEQTQRFLTRTAPLRQAAHLVAADASRCAREGKHHHAARRFEALGGIIRQLGSSPMLLDMIIADSVFLLAKQRAEDLINAGDLAAPEARAFLRLRDDRWTAWPVQFRRALAREYEFQLAIAPMTIREIIMYPRVLVPRRADTDMFTEAQIRSIHAISMWCMSWTGLRGRLRYEAFVGAYAARELGDQSTVRRREERLQRLFGDDAMVDRLRAIADNDADL